MNKKQLRLERLGRITFVGCQYCGTIDRPLRNHGSGKICPECLAIKTQVSKLDTGKEGKNG